MALEDEQDDAARAFEDFAAEVRVMRRAMEALEAKKPTHHTPTLAEFAQKLEKLTIAMVAMVAMVNRPAMKLTPDSYAAQIARATTAVARPAAAELQRVQTLTGTLERALGAVRTRQEQRRWVFRAAIGGMAAGVFVWALLLPMARSCSTAGTFPRSWRRASSARTAGRQDSA